MARECTREFGQWDAGVSENQCAHGSRTGIDPIIKTLAVTELEQTQSRKCRKALCVSYR